MTAVIDLYKLAENERITVIVNAIRAKGGASILLETEDLAPGKIQRYVRKIKRRVAGIATEIRPGPVENVSLVIFVRGQ